MKLKLEHLAPYLPYKLNYLEPSYKSDCDWFIPSREESVKVMNTFSINVILTNEDCNPILRPLSELEKFSPAIYKYSYLKNGKYINRMQYLEIQILLKNHFDIFGLIENKLAIDINNLK